MPELMVNIPMASQAVRQPQPLISTCAINGNIVRPMPWMIPIKANAIGRRRMNQLLTAVDVPNSNGLENTARPGTYNK
jgi:hypothetical protein